MPIKVELYDLLTSSGRHIRKATKVTIDSEYSNINGEVKFIEKMGKKEAIRQALEFLRKERWWINNI